MKKGLIKIITSLFVAGAVVFYFWEENKKAKNEILAYTETVQVLQAKKFIKKGATLTKKMVEVVSIPKRGVQPTALNDVSGLYNEKGQPFLKARVGLMKGEQIMRSKLLDQKAFLGLAWLLEPGQTALTLQLNPEEAVGGWVQPGNWVHVLATLEASAHWPKPQTRIFINTVRVLAINQQVWDPSAIFSIKNKTKTLAGEPFLVTLGLSPKQAAMASLLHKKGRVSLALVSPFEGQFRKKVSISLENLK